MVRLTLAPRLNATALTVPTVELPTTIPDCVIRTLPVLFPTAIEVTLTLTLAPMFNETALTAPTVVLPTVR